MNLVCQTKYLVSSTEVSIADEQILMKLDKVAVIEDVHEGGITWV